MFKMGTQPSSMNKVNFEDIQWLIKKQKSYLLINTLAKEHQQCLIKGTVPVDREGRKLGRPRLCRTHGIFP